MNDSYSDVSSMTTSTRGGVDDLTAQENVRPRYELTSVVHELLHEDLVSVDCQRDVLALLGSNGSLVIRDMDRDNYPPITSQVRNPVRVFVHPQGKYVVASGSDGEMYFFDAHAKKIATHFPLYHNVKSDGSSPPVSNAGNNVAESVYWAYETVQQTLVPGGFGSANTEAVTSVVLLVGTRLGGIVFEVRVDISGDGSTIRPLCKQILQFPPEVYQLPIAGIEAEKINLTGTGEKGLDEWVIFVSTPSRLFRVEGLGSPSNLLASATVNPSMLTARSVGGAVGDTLVRGTFQIFRPGSGERNVGQSYCWASTAGLVHGLFRRSVTGVDPSETFILEPQMNSTTCNEQILPLSKARATDASRRYPLPDRTPFQVALSAFNMYLLYDDRLIVLNHPAGVGWRASSQEKRSDVPLDAEVLDRIRFDPFRGGQRSRHLTGIVRDTASRRIYVFGGSSIWEVVVENEHRQQWRIFGERAMDANLPRYMRHRYLQATYQLSAFDRRRRSQVQLIRGKFFLECGMVKTATSVLADCDMFDEVFHLLVSLKNQRVIRWYLEKKQKYLARNRASYSSMLVPLACLDVLLSVYKLDAITRSEASPARLTESVQSLTTFLAKATDDIPTVFRDVPQYYDIIARLLSGQGRLQNLLSFAELMNRLHYTITYLISQGKYAEACDQLGAHASEPAVEAAWYEFAPTLITQTPIRLVAAMSRAVSKDSRGQVCLVLHVERLIPSFVHYTPSLNEDPSNGEHQVIIFLERSIMKYNCVSTVVHNFYVSLLAQYDPERLDTYLSESFFYNMEFALRRCLELRRYRQCVTLYKRLHLFEDALTMAIECSQPDAQGRWVGLELAKSMLRPPIPDEVDAVSLKKLWLIVAQHVIDRVGTRAALAIVEESNGILKLEDILDRISDSTVVQNFKDAVCRSLDTYTVAINDLNAKHLEANRIAESVKSDINNLRHRYGYVTAQQRCVLCQRGLLRGGAPFLVFPSCGHVVHEQCAVQRLAQIGGFESFLANESLAPKYMDGVESLEDLAQVECVLCGECAIMEVDASLYTPDSTWSVE